MDGKNLMILKFSDGVGLDIGISYIGALETIGSCQQ